MKKYIIAFIIVFLYTLIIFNSQEIKDFITINKANSLYTQNNYNWASLLYDSINYDFLSSNNKDRLNFLKWNLLYKQWKYFEAFNIYNKITWEDNLVKFYKYNVLWDAKYRMWEWWNDFDKTKNRQEALNFYSSAINEDLRIDKTNTIKNYDFVKSKLEKLKKKLQDEQKNNQNNSKSGTGSEEKNDNSESIKNRTWKNSWNYSNPWNNLGIDKWEKLTPEQKQKLKDYSDWLKEFQKNNNQYLQRWTNSDKQLKSQDLFNNMLKQMQNDPFFKQVIPQDWVEKDW